MADVTFRPSPFFDPGPTAAVESLAILHLKRDQLIPLILNSSAQPADGYAEGAVTNTRFGSFPHSTLLDVPWGSQVLASKVDTGSRGRKKRKVDETGSDATHTDSAAPTLKAAVQAGTGFVHLLPPTPESWTVSLPHRTQVVYTPDYSYVLQRLQVRPGQTIIEAGAGSGSFTHASARAVFSGYPSQSHSADGEASRKRRRYGRVCSFEYHEPRVVGLRKEIEDHGLADIVRVTHRDVYQDGFSLDDAQDPSPKADAIFLDLPAPWMALKHLTRQRITSKTAQIVSNSANTDPGDVAMAESNGSAESTTPTDDRPFVSPLNPKVPIHLCTFSPCIEQVSATVSAMRRLGWTEIDMVEVMHKRIDVRRERVGLHEEGLRGVNATAATVDEAVGRLKEVEGRFKEWHEQTRSRTTTGQLVDGDESTPTAGKGKQARAPQRAPQNEQPFESKQERLQRIKRDAETRKTFKEGRLVHRTEPEIKTHTSYLVFAVLPREWTSDQEETCRRKWGVEGKVTVDTESGKKEGKKKKKS
ncbi:hypothetical protein MBLNU459_g3196t1 [Dothideomycetes sp. NU459]